MARPEERSYRFAKAAHWAAGAASGLRPEGDFLIVDPPLAAERIDQGMAGILAAVGPCDRLAWLEPASGELYELNAFGAERQGRIATHAPLAIHSGAGRLWVHEPGLVRRFAAGTRQYLGAVELPGLVASAGDGCDGLWLLLEGDGGGFHVRWLDPLGRLCLPPVQLVDPLRPIAIAVDFVRRRIAIIDVAEDWYCGHREWRLHIVDFETCVAYAPFVFTLRSGETPPRLIAADADGGFHVAATEARGLLIKVSADGIEMSRQILPDPASPARALLWQAGRLVVVTADGLYRLAPAPEGAKGVAAAKGIFITPALMSPPGTPSGWNRAEIALSLPEGASLKVTVVATSDSARLDAAGKAFADTPRSPAIRVETLKRVIGWRDGRTRSFKGTGDQMLHVLLDRIPETHVWLRIELECPSGSGPAILKGLRVRYPDRSWLDELPAIYRDEPASAAELRQFLAPFEALYGGIDETIDALAARIDPATADKSWLPWLLGWLGFPPTAGLTPDVQRRLLEEAGRLLVERGTLAALKKMLDIVTQGRARVEDKSAGAAFWIVGGARTRLSPRLGRDTRIVSRVYPGSFVPGRGARLGEALLPTNCTDIGRVLGGQCARIAVRLAIAPERREVVEPIIHALLAMFVPAHCRIELTIAAAGAVPAGERLGRGLRLAGAGETQDNSQARLAPPPGAMLGRSSRTGGWQLPRRPRAPFTIDGNAALDGDRRIA